MGVIGNLFAMLFGSGRNVLKETAEVFRPNAENDAQRNHTANAAVMAQFAAKFGHKGWFNQFVDALNRLRVSIYGLWRDWTFCQRDD